jgi:hypothetical protein
MPVSIERRKQYHQEYNAAWYKVNREKRLVQTKLQKQRVRDWFYNEFKPTLSCIKCGENHPACIEFHHHNGRRKGKDYPVTNLSTHGSKKRILEEVKKCDVLCANCHSKEHYMRD